MWAKTLVFAIIGLCIYGNAEAYHMMDYSFGNIEIYGGCELFPTNTFSIQDPELNSSGGELEKGYYGVKIGLGGKWDASFTNAEYGNRMNFSMPLGGTTLDVPFRGDVTFREYRVSYHPDRNWELYAQDSHVIGISTAHHPIVGDIHLDSENHRFLAGFRYAKPIGHQTAAYVGLGLGDGIQRAETGVTISLEKNWAMDISYQYNKLTDMVTYDPLPGAHFDFDVESSGLYVGLAYHF